MKRQLTRVAVMLVTFGLSVALMSLGGYGLITCVTAKFLSRNC